jgi:hypothetical protein
MSSSVETQVEIMRAAGIEDEQIVKLAALRRRIAAGGCDDLTIEYKRSMFLKYLYEGGVVHD